MTPDPTVPSGPPVRFGVLGAGRITCASFAPAVAASSGATLAAAASRDVERARGTGAQHAYGSYAELLDDPEVEAVYVATHNGLHRELTLAAIERGKHVLCEKPLARNAEECGEMAAAARQAGVVLEEAFMYRHHPQIALARKLVRDGAIGDLRTVEAAFSFHLTKDDDVRLNPEWGGGALLDVGCYCVSACRLFLGNEPRRVVAAGHFHPQHGVDMAVHGVLEYENGRFGVISCGFDGGLRQHVICSGTGGTLTIPYPFISWHNAPCVIVENGAERTEHLAEPADVFQLEVEDFARAVRGGGGPLLAPEEGLRNARILDALLAAAHAGRELPPR